MQKLIISYDCFEGCGDTEVYARSRAEVVKKCRKILKDLGGGRADVFNSDDKWLFYVEV